MTTGTITENLFFDQLTDQAKKHARNTNEALFWMDYDISEEVNNILWAIDSFNDCVSGGLKVFNAHGPATEMTAPNKCDFFEAVETSDTASGDFPEIAEAYNAFIESHRTELDSILHNLEIAEEASENVPLGEPDYHIYDVIRLQDEYASIIDEALEEAAAAANEALEGAREMYADEYEVDELLSQFYWTESGEYVGAM